MFYRLRATILYLFYHFADHSSVCVWTDSTKPQTNIIVYTFRIPLGTHLKLDD